MFMIKANFTLENQHANKIPAFFYQVDYCLYDELPDDIAYFHAQWRRERLTEKTKDYTILDGVKGKGHYIGTYMALTTLERYWWGEGEMKFYIDGDEEYPPSVEQERKITLVVPGALPNRWMEKPWNRIITRRIWDIRIILPMTS